MSFEVLWSESAARQLRGLDRAVARRIFRKVSELRENPHRLVRKIVNSPYCRLRVGKYGVISDIEQDSLRVLIL